MLWKTSFLVPAPEQSTLSDQLLSHCMSRRHQRPQMRSSLDPLQSEYTPDFGVDDTTVYMLQRANCQEKSVITSAMSWITDYMTACNM